jgi:hypothetical protein
MLASTASGLTAPTGCRRLAVKLPLRASVLEIAASLGYA